MGGREESVIIAYAAGEIIMAGYLKFLGLKLRGKSRHYGSATKV